jgi:hypothetical protein
MFGSFKLNSVGAAVVFVLAAGVSVRGGVVFIPAPASALEGAQEDDANLFLFLEQNRVVLPAMLRVDFIAPGTYPPLPGPQFLGAGTAVRSYMVYSDPVGNGAPGGTLVTGQYRFSSDILGVIVLSERLTATDGLLGAPGTIYTPQPLRGLEINQDFITLSADQRTLSFRFRTFEFIDAVRVLTRPVPEPGTVAVWSLLACLAGGGRLLCRRKS